MLSIVSGAMSEGGALETADDSLEGGDGDGDEVGVSAVGSDAEL